MEKEYKQNKSWGEEVQVKKALIIMRDNNISNIHSRLYQKAFGKKGHAKDWDVVIKAL